MHFTGYTRLVSKLFLKASSEKVEMLVYQHFLLFPHFFSTKYLCFKYIFFLFVVCKSFQFEEGELGEGKNSVVLSNGNQGINWLPSD